MGRFVDLVEKFREREAPVSFEFYRLLKNAITRGLIYEETKCEFTDVIPEFPIGRERADLVVLASSYGRPEEPFLVVEVKARAFKRPGPSIAAATRRALSYAKGLNAVSTPLFAVYDGWTLWAFRGSPPFVIGVYGSVTDEYQVSNFLLGLEEFRYRNRSDSLDSLPEPADPTFLFKRVMPSLAKGFAEDPEKARSLLASWKSLLPEP